MRHHGGWLSRPRTRRRPLIQRRRRTVGGCRPLGRASLAPESLETRNLLAAGTLYAVNAGGAEIIAADTTVWEEDTSASPSPYSNQATAGNHTFGNGKVVNTTLVPPEVPSSIFNTERYDTGGIPMQWDFPVAPGDYEIRLYFAEIFNGAHSVGARVFDVSIEGNLVLDDYDIFAAAGPDTAIMQSFVVSTDANIDIDFTAVVENPAIKGIEILVVTEANTLLASAATLDFASVDVGDAEILPVTLLNTGGSGDPSITISSSAITGSATFTDDFDDIAGVTLAPGESTVVNVTFLPTSASAEAATLEFTHSGLNNPISVALQGTGMAPPVGVSLVRINAGGPAVGNPEWSEDSSANPSPLSNVAASGSTTFTTTMPIDISDPSIPVGTPTSIFASERYDLIGGDEMKWDIPVAAGPYEVRLYFAETFAGAGSVGARVFDVSIEDTLLLDDYDVFADVGLFAGVVKSFTIFSDDTIDIDLDRVAQNPAIKAIEIVSLAQPNALFTDEESLDFGTAFIGTPVSQTLTISNPDIVGAPAITISSTTITGAATFVDDFDDASGVVLAPGESLEVEVVFTPVDTTSQQAVLEFHHSGLNNPLTVDLSGIGTDVAPIGFGKSLLSGVASTHNPTSLQWGPDDRLYVAHQNGTINVYSIVRNAANDYTATLDDQITLIKNIPNHDDDGTVNQSINTRLVTGLFVAGTAAAPEIYVTSSDPRIGAGPGGEDLNLDTNSGVLSRLTWDGAQWNKLDLVRGLPRSEENHTANGLVIDPTTNTLYLTQGGNTNAGAPSNNFALLPEYAYSAAILSVDLDAIDLLASQTDVNGQVYKYDLPTLDDEDRDFDGNGSDVDLANNIQDVFGGNDGKNQAILVPGGPVQVYAPGFRNPYDVVLTEAGNLYTIDNGANAGWGDVAVIDPVSGLATNEINEPGVTLLDNLHFVSGPGYYGGHPNPTRANTDNTFNITIPQSPVSLVGGNPLESFFSVPQASTGALAVFGSSTNGIVEYTASNFGGAMQGDLLAASYFGGNSISRLSPDATGAALDLNEMLFSNVGVAPLDVTALGDSGPFPGTIWVADWFSNTVVVFEPSDFDGGGGGPGDPDDLDGDGYTNEDEIANDTDPNNAADVPPDFDGDFVSNLLDDNDDNDSLLDVDDPFAIDPDNGNTTFIDVEYTWENDDPNPGGLLNLGFTGLMINGVDNYEDLFDTEAMTAGGAAGVLTLDAATEGDALGGLNTQEQAFQFGVNVSGESDPFAARTRILTPFSGITPSGEQSMGLFLGSGDQDNYVKIVVTAAGGAGGISTLSEVGGVVSTGSLAPVALPGPSFIDLYLTVSPGELTVQPSYEITQGGTTGPRIELGTPIAIPAGWLNGPTALAVGIISTSKGSAPEFPATWDFVTVVAESASLQATPEAASIQSVEVGQTVSRSVVITHTGAPTSSPIVLDATSISGAGAGVFSDSFDDTGEVTLQPGESTVIAVMFSPTAVGQADAVLEIAHDGAGSPLLVPLAGHANPPLTLTAASFSIAPGNDIDSSTFGSGSFEIANLSLLGQKITEVVLDLSTAILPDMVFDPFGQAGDTATKVFTPDSSGALVGLGAHQLGGLHDGGFDTLTIPFSDFNSGETFSFSIDVDPTSIKGVAPPGPNESGSVSGLELVGATVTIVFDDGTKQAAQLYRIGSSLGSSENTLLTDTTSPPLVELVGTPYSPTGVTGSLTHTARVSAPAGKNVKLLVVESGLFTDGVPGGGFDIDPFESNSALGASEYQAVIGAGGFVEIPVTLLNSDPDGGLNTLVAVVQEDHPHTSLLSPPLVVQFISGANTLPTVVAPIGAIVAAENGPDAVIDLTTVFDDLEDGTSLTYTVESNDNSTLVDASIVSSTLTLDYLPDQFGAATIVIRATDSGGLFVEDTITLLVNASTPGSVALENGFVANVSSDAWTTISLANSYTSMVVVATPNYDGQSPPLVTRIQNATGSSFDVMVQRADGLAAPVTADVYFFVIEEGVYTVAEHGVSLEAVKYVSTVTDGVGSWAGEARSYSNPYASPVVLGQVMTYNDPAFSTFWSKGVTIKTAPSSTTLFTGKHVGEDTKIRADETIGYVVFEAGSWTIGGIEVAVGLGPNSVEGVTQAPAVVYAITAPSDPTGAVLSQAGMDGSNGSWALLNGATPFSSTTLNLSVDEDQLGDSERFHIAEEVAYIVFGSSAGSSLQLVVESDELGVASGSFSVSEPDTVPGDVPRRVRPEPDGFLAGLLPVETPRAEPSPAEARLVKSAERFFSAVEARDIDLSFIDLGSVGHDALADNPIRGARARDSFADQSDLIAIGRRATDIEAANATDAVWRKLTG